MTNGWSKCFAFACRNARLTPNTVLTWSTNDLSLSTVDCDPKSYKYYNNKMMKNCQVNNIVALKGIML